MPPRYGHTLPLVGVDYGSKLAGTTACAIAHRGQVSLHCSEKKRDADAWLLKLLATQDPGLLAIDVPLSLPGVYRSLPDCDDYHYRTADRVLGAMSPMFLGGLTARGMALAARLRENGWRVLETYPGGLVRELGWTEFYRQKRRRDAGVSELESLAPLQQKLTDPLAAFGHLPEASNYHEIDGLLALLSAGRFVAGGAKLVGDAAEGQIVI